MISVAIIDDNRLSREAITSLLSRVPDVTVVAAAQGIHDAAVRNAAPQVVLFDVGLRDMGSLHGTAAMQKEFPTARVVAMDLPPAHQDIAEFVNAGVSGFILKDAPFEDYLSTIRSVAEGTEVLPPRMTGSLFSQIAQDVISRSRSEVFEHVRLTRREREVIELIAEGLSNKEMAQRLNIGTYTVKTHVRNIMEKLALHTRLQIAAYSHREGISGSGVT